VEKAAGDRTPLYLTRAANWHAMPDAAGGEGVHEVAKPDGVIHRCIFNRLAEDIIEASECLKNW